MPASETTSTSDGTSKSGSGVSLVAQWQVEADLEGGKYNHPIIATASEVVVGGENKKLRGLDSNTGETLWSLERPGKGVTVSHPATDGEHVYVTDRSGSIAAYDVRDGAIAWRESIPYTDRTFTIHRDGTVVCICSGATADGQSSSVRAFDSTEGGVLWSLSDSDLSRDGSDYVWFKGGVTDVGGNRLLLLFANSQVMLDLSTGDVLSAESVRFNAHRPGASKNGVVFLPSETTVHAVSIRSFSPRWSFDPEGSPTTGCVLHDEQLFFGSDDRNLYALAVADGSELWRFSTFNEINCRPLLYSDVVFAGSDDHHVYAIDSGSGNEHDRVKLDDKVRAIVPAGSGVVALTDSSAHGIRIQSN